MSREYYIEIDGKKEPMEESMLAWLLDEGYVFISSAKHVCHMTGKVEDETLTIFLNCNDVFAWGYADAEGITYKELPELFDMVMMDKKHGATKWVCKKRGMKPQKPIREGMERDGAWGEELDRLEENVYDRLMREKYNK
jgi:hypothetical protein